MPKESFEFFDLFSEIGQSIEDRKEKIEKGDFKMLFNEDTFLKNRPDWEKDLFRQINHFLLYEIQKGVEVHFLETYCRYSRNNLMFCKMKTTLEALKIYLKLRYQEIENPQRWVRDYAKISRQTWSEVTIRQGDLVSGETILLDNVFELVRQAFNRIVKYPKLSKVSVEKTVKTLPNFVTPTRFALNLNVSTDGFVEVGLKVHKSQLPKIIEKLLE